MGRPSVGKRAMTDAERQRRRRKKLRREGKEAEIAAKQAKNHAVYLASMRDCVSQVVGTLAPPLQDPAEELVEQLLAAIQLSPEITLADIQAAIARRLVDATARGSATAIGQP